MVRLNVGARLKLDRLVDPGLLMIDMVRLHTSSLINVKFKMFMCMFKWLKKLFCKEESQVPQTVVEPVVKVQKEIAVAPKKKRPYKPRAKKKDVNVK